MDDLNADSLKRMLISGANVTMQPEVVDFTEAKPGQAAYAYIDENKLSEHYCVFQLDWFDEREGEVPLRRQKWLLLDEESYTLPSPYPAEEDEDVLGD
jgi:hypothetical protein